MTSLISLIGFIIFSFVICWATSLIGMWDVTLAVQKLSITLNSQEKYEFLKWDCEIASLREPHTVGIDLTSSELDKDSSLQYNAAKIMGTESCNGWTYWHCNINGSTVVIDSLRQKFISETKA